MRGDRILPDWLEEGTETSLRDTEDDTPPPAVAAVFTSAQRSKGSSRLASPAILTPAEGSSPAGSTMRNNISKGPWTDLDKFYDEDDSGHEEDDSEDEESEGGDDEDDPSGLETGETGDENHDSDEESSKDEHSEDEDNLRQHA